MIVSPRAWYMLWWTLWTLAAVGLAYVALVRPITRRLDALIAAVAK